MVTLDYSATSEPFSPTSPASIDLPTGDGLTYTWTRGRPHVSYPIATYPAIVIVSSSLNSATYRIILTTSKRFSRKTFHILHLSGIASIRRIGSFIKPHISTSRHSVTIFRAVISPTLHTHILSCLNILRVHSISLVNPALTILSSLVNIPPGNITNIVRGASSHCFRHVRTVRCFIRRSSKHNYSSLSNTSVILLNMSHASGAPLSVCLTCRNCGITGIPLTRNVRPPGSVCRISPVHLFNLVSAINIVSRVHSDHLNSSCTHTITNSCTRPRDIHDRLRRTHTLVGHLNYFIIHASNGTVRRDTSRVVDRLRRVRRTHTHHTTH